MILMSIEQKRALEGLFFWSKVAPAIDSREAAGQFELLARQLDRLGVPWKTQNKVAYAATLPANRDRYFSDVLKEII
jgi:hypothetical protein